MQSFKEIIKRKDLILYLVITGLKAQHRNTFLGYFWWLLDPMLNMIIYYFLVAKIFKGGGRDYAIYLLVGLMVWRWFHATVSSATEAIISRATLIKQISIPKIIFPFCVILTQAINFVFALVILSTVSLLLGLSSPDKVLWLFYIMLMQIIFTTAFVLPVAYIGIFVRDLNNVVKHLMHLWFFATPVIWRSGVTKKLPVYAETLLNFNPMKYFLEGYRKILVYGGKPDFQSLFFIGVISFLVVVLMVSYYNRNEHKIAKVL